MTLIAPLTHALAYISNTRVPPNWFLSFSNTEQSPKNNVGMSKTLSNWKIISPLRTWISWGKDILSHSVVSTVALSRMWCPGEGMSAQAKRWMGAFLCSPPYPQAAQRPDKTWSGTQAVIAAVCFKKLLARQRRNVYLVSAFWKRMKFLLTCEKFVINPEPLFSPLVSLSGDGQANETVESREYRLLTFHSHKPGCFHIH